VGVRPRHYDGAERDWRVTWTAETVIALAPDAASAKAGRDLAARRTWSSLGRTEPTDAGAVAVWGACQGSGKDPYLTRIDTSEPAFKCSCPSRKFPCKHSLGLFLLFVQSPGEFTAATPPDWVAEWLDGRASRASKKADRDAKDAEPSPPEDDATSVAKREKAAKQAAARGEERERRVAAGVSELRLWLHDLVRQGLSSAAGRPASYWETMAARLVDAQAPGAARLVRQLESIPASGDGWPDRLLDRIARLHLLIDAYDRIDALPPDIASDVRATLGWTIPQESLLESVGVRDHWGIVGRITTDDDRLRVQRTWLWGRDTRRGALVLHFAPLGQARAEMKPIDPTLVPGTAFDGTLVFFPSAAPMRAIIKERTAPVEWNANQGHESVTDAISAAVDAEARVPWVERHPVLLSAAVVTVATSPLLVKDTYGRSLPIATGFRERFRLLAVTGGSPAPLFGEWNGDAFRPLTVWGEAGAVALA
jgi:hypothetical protein